MKDHHLRARLPRDEYLKLKANADAVGLTLSEYVRNVLMRDRQALEQEQFLAQVDARLAALSAAPAAPSGSANQERLLVEVLLLVRELAADRNAQILARVAHQVNQRYAGGNP